MKKLFYIFFLTFPASYAIAQNVSEKTGLRFYEHHSSDMTQAPFGNDANGAQSGYDFVNHRYYGSFDQTSYSGYTMGEEANLDMVEHNGPFGSGGANMYLGFTSGSSTIWNGAIKGNEETKWMKAPSGFNYTAITSATDIRNAYNASTASFAIDEVKINEVYIGRIRNSSMYVAIKCTDRLAPAGNPQGQTANVYFDFNYKYGSIATGLAQVQQDVLSIYPNPAKDIVRLDVQHGDAIKSVKIYSITGAEVFSSNSLTTNKLDLRNLPAGLYFVNATTSSGQTLVTRLIKQPI